MTRFIGAGPASAIAAFCMFAIGGSTAAQAEVRISAPVVQSVVNASSTITTMARQAAAANVTVSLPQLNAVGAPIASTAASATTTIAATASSLWPLIWANLAGAPLDEEMNCLATAVYFEARGEPFDGQLAVAEVVINRARSGRYPTSYCGVVKQPWQFSFVRAGRFPRVDTGSQAWSYAQAIARIAQNRLAAKLPGDVLWYHADYVAPSWGRRLSKVDKIGAHIFYRA